jgi:hypothetical protein
MITTAIFPRRYVQGDGALELLGEETGRLGPISRLLLMNRRSIRNSCRSLSTLPGLGDPVALSECRPLLLRRPRPAPST